MKKLYAYRTRVGTFYIIEDGGRFHPTFEGEPLGSYHSPDQAADDLAGGHTFSVPGGHDTSRLGIPESVGDWEKLT